MGDEIIKNLGPLAALSGTWSGDTGVDISRVHSKETETKYRERIIFEPLGPVKNWPTGIIRFTLLYDGLAFRRK